MENASGNAKLDVDAYMGQMRQEMEACLREVGQAVNAAPDGAWINGSEMTVRDVFARMRQRAYETALQMRLDAAQAAFSPGGPGDGAASGKQGIGSPQHVDG
jgi:hypothetical protein